MTEYRLNDPHQGLIGPVQLQTVKDLVEAGVIQDDVLVSRDDGPFEPITSFSELRKPPVTPEGAPKASYAGDLGKNTFFKVFYRFHLTHATGLLTFKDKTYQKDVYLEDGQPVFVASNVESERLGQFLVLRGKIDEDDLEVALSAMHTDHNQLGATLIRLGLMDPQDLYAQLQEQQVLRLVDLCGWETGRYQFFDGQRYFADKVNLHLTATDLILRAARGMDEPTLLRRLRPHLNEVVTRLPNEELDSGLFPLSAAEQRAANGIDGKRSVASLVGQFASDKERKRAALMVVYLLSEIDAVTFD